MATIRGWVYIITNEAMPGLLKIGYSTKDPVLRAEELGHTGAPLPYKVAYDALVFGPRDLEQRAHAALKDHEAGKEWFKCDLQTAVGTIRKVAGDSIILESSSSNVRGEGFRPVNSSVKKVFDPRGLPNPTIRSQETAYRCWNCGTALDDPEGKCSKCGCDGPLRKR